MGQLPCVLLIIGPIRFSRARPTSRNRTRTDRPMRSSHLFVQQQKSDCWNETLFFFFFWQRHLSLYVGTIPNEEMTHERRVLRIYGSASHHQLSPRVNFLFVSYRAAKNIRKLLNCALKPSFVIVVVVNGKKIWNVFIPRFFFQKKHKKEVPT